MKTRLFLSGLLVVISGIVQAQEAKVVLRSTVTGNQEQPKVLYIVPWQQADIPGLSYQPMQNLVEGIYDQVDREEFLRELSYREKINATLIGATPRN
jgi:hypothetical protein